MKIICTLEKIIRKVKIYSKIFYFKCKYGRNLKIGKKIQFRKRFNINIAKGGFLEIGDNNFFNDDCSINVHNSIVIGDKNLFGKNVNIYDHNHVFDNKKVYMPTNFYANKIKIGNQNWFGTNVIILNKTEIDNENVISAGVILNEKIGSNNIVKNETKLKIKKIKYKE